MDNTWLQFVSYSELKPTYFLFFRNEYENPWDDLTTRWARLTLLDYYDSALHASSACNISLGFMSGRRTRSLLSTRQETFLLKYIRRQTADIFLACTHASTSSVSAAILIKLTHLNDQTRSWRMAETSLLSTNERLSYSQCRFNRTFICSQFLEKRKTFCIKPTGSSTV